MSETITWIDADGTSYQLSGQSDRGVLQGLQGRFMPPFRRTEDVVPLQPGARLRDVQADAREVDVPISFKSASATALRTQVRAFLLRFSPARGDGKLRVTGPGGDQRELICRYAGGMELDEGQGVYGAAFQRAVLTFRAVDPYWYATSATVATYTTGEVATFFPFFPLRISASEIFADATVDNGGDVETWPEWIVTGPGSSIVLRNLTTGKLLSIGTTLADGETATVDTAPGAKKVEKNDGTNLFSTLSSDSSLWPLERGSNSIRIEMTGATADSSVQLTFTPRYLGA